MARAKTAERSPPLDPRFSPPLTDGAGAGGLVPVQGASVLDAHARELARIQRIQGQMAAMEDACQAYVNGDVQRLQPLRAQWRDTQRALARQMAHWLGTAGDDLSRSQRAQARHSLVCLTQGLAELGDAEMAALHDAHSPQSLAEKRRAATEALRARLADWLAPDNTQAHSAAEPDALWQAARRQWQDQAQVQQAQRVARQAKREARKAQRPTSAAAQQEVHAEQEAGATLRGIYRRLASALHPDRATSEAERTRLHQLMSAANAAYARQDLLALLELQGQANLAAPRQRGQSSDQRLQALTWLLKRQAASLERERQLMQQRWWQRLALEAGTPLVAAELQQRLQAQHGDLTQALEEAETALARVTELAGLKRWLNAQAAQRRHGSAALFERY